MAEIFRASEPRSAGEPRIVVVKRMLPHIAAHPEARSMFDEEGRLGAMVWHRNVVEMLGRGEAEGHPYLALEYVPGADLWRLDRWLARQGRTLGVPLSVLIVRDLLAGLHAVHELVGSTGEPLGIVHRDVSPSNVLLSMHGDVKLGDFGIARSRLQERLGESHMLHRAKGKLGYLSPEQVTGAHLDRRSDIFSAAVVAAELLMGRPLFAGSSELAILLSIRDATISPFLEAATSLPEGLGNVIARALARDPDRRIPNAETFRELLAPYVPAGIEAAMRRELGELVVAAMGSDADVPEATPLQEIPWEVSAAQGQKPRPHPPEPSPPTGQTAATYQVRMADGSMLGPFKYADVVEAVSTGHLGAGDWVSVGGAALRPLAAIPEFERHLPLSTLTPFTGETEAPRPPDECISLAGGGIITALARSALRAETGLWLCDQGGVRKEVYVAEGAPQFVTSNLAGELLGEFLVAHGVVTRGELDMALAVMPRFEGKLGDTLVALGLVEPVQLFRHIADQVRDKLLDLFEWDAGVASFYRGVASPKSRFPLGLDPWRILDEGAFRRFSAGLEAQSWRPGRTLVRAARLPTDLSEGKLPATMKGVLKRADQPLPVERLGPVNGTCTEAQRAALVLLHLDALRWADAEPPSP